MATWQSYCLRIFGISEVRPLVSTLPGQPFISAGQCSLERFRKFCSRNAGRFCETPHRRRLPQTAYNAATHFLKSPQWFRFLRNLGSENEWPAKHAKGRETGRVADGSQHIRRMDCEAAAKPLPFACCGALPIVRNHAVCHPPRLAPYAVRRLWPSRAQAPRASSAALPGSGIRSPACTAELSLDAGANAKPSPKVTSRPVAMFSAVSVWLE